MLPLSYTIQNLSFSQKLALEKSVQSKVTYDSPTLQILNGLLLGENKQQITSGSFLNELQFEKFKRPILTALLELFELTTNTTRDNFFNEVHHAIQDESLEQKVKIKKLEDLFHQMKRYNMEQESAPLLSELVRLNQTTPLKAVYTHLENKYNHYNNINNQCYAFLNNLNEDLAEYLNDESEIEIKDLIQYYKNIRILNEKVENKTSLAILNTAKLLLVIFCNQSQLLKENNSTSKKLFFKTLKSVNYMPFGLERFYLLNNLVQTQKYAIEELQLNIEPILTTTTLEAPNFSFKLDLDTLSKTKSTQPIEMNNYYKLVAPFNLKQNSLSLITMT